MELPTKPWQGTTEEVLNSLDSSWEGLSDFEADKRLLHFGSNSIARKTPLPYLKIFLDQFADLLVVMLVIAAALSLILGDSKSGLIIFLIVFLNASIGFTQEFKAEKILKALIKYLPSLTRVLRGNLEREINTAFLVPGDLVILGEGDKVPADLRLIEAYELKTNDQALTGESKPQVKKAKVYQAEVSLIEVENCLFMGTMVASGTALGVVTATGMQTEFGKIAQRTTAIQKTLSPLQEKTKRMAKKIAVLAGLVVIALVLYKYFTDQKILEAFMFSIAVAASLVPEGLPATISVALSFGAKTLARQRALVKNLVSVETLGSTSVICTDKTGTLTTGKMEVKEVWSSPCLEINKDEQERLIEEAMVLCNDAHFRGTQAIGDPTEIALLDWVQKKGISPEEIFLKYHKRDEIPFTSRRKFMSVSFQDGGKKFAYLKGAPEVIVLKCHLEEREKELIEKKAQELASAGLRVLGLAYQEIFLGLVAIFDPPRPEVKAAIDGCQKGQIKVIMITGDHSLTALSIAKMVGITLPEEEEEIVTGDQLERMSDLKLRNILQGKPIFTRTLPEQKYRIVDNLMKMGEIVALTGDGVNDAPALKRADIGIAMGRGGTDVSREAADMILLDDNFATIISAVRLGRIIFDNIKKFLFYIFSSNFGELMTVVFGMIFGLPLPITAVLILSVDLGTDVLPSMSLIAESPNKDVMEGKPRAKEIQLLTGESFIHLAIIGLVMGLGAVGNFYSVLKVTNNYQAATTAAFATLVISQGFNIFLSRCHHTSIFKYPFWNNFYLIASVFFSQILLFVIIYSSFFQGLLSVAVFPAYFWPQIFLVGVVFLIIEELYKSWRIKSLSS